MGSLRGFWGERQKVDFFFTVERSSFASEKGVKSGVKRGSLSFFAELRTSLSKKATPLQAGTQLKRVCGSEI